MQITQMLTEDRLARGFQLGDYSLLDQIGLGGEGAVWSAWDNRRNRVVAVKIMAVGDPMFATQASSEFERQVHLLASLEHPNILPLYEFGMTDEYYYFVMKYSCAGSLAGLLTGGPLSLEEVLYLASQISFALEYLHRRAIVHRDLKPSNILIDGQRRIYLADFGLAKRLIQETAPFHTGRGTGAYAPYEQHIPNLITPQSDIYSLGVVIYEMFAGKLPWDGSIELATQQFQTGQELPELHSFIPGLPPSITNVLRQMTAFDWSNRPSSAGDAFRLMIKALPENFQKNTEELLHPMPALDEGVLIAEDGQYLLDLFLPEWNPGKEKFPASLTNLAYIDSAYRQSDQYSMPTEEQYQEFMLRGALTYGYHLDYWWKQVSDPQIRIDVCEQAISNEDDETIARALSRMTGESRSNGSLIFSAETLERFIDIAAGAKGWALRNDALKVLKQTDSHASHWRPVGITAAGDAKLAELALSDSSLARQSAELIGQIHSETAVQALVNAQSTTNENHIVDILKEIRTAAGSLPSLVPMRLRAQIVANVMREQFFEDREGLSWSRSLIGLVIGVVATLLMMAGIFSQPEAQMKDVFLQPYPVSGIVTIVEVNDESLARYGRWDRWPRTLHAELIDRLLEAGAQTIVFDFIFDAPTPEDPVLVEAMEKAGNVVQPVLGQGDAFHDPAGTYRYEHGVLPQSALLLAAAAVGNTNILHDEDGYVRRIPTIVTIDGERQMNLGLAALQVFLGAGIDTEFVVPEPVDNTLEIAGRQIPVGDLGEMSVYYAGPPADSSNSVFNKVSYQDVLDRKASSDLFKDKIVLIGMTATAEPDRYLTPVSRGRPMYGVEILANVIESTWSGRFIVQPHMAIRGLVLILLGIMTGLICTRPWSGLLLAIAVAVLYFVISGWVFDLQGTLPDLLFPLFTIAFSYATVTAYRFSIEVRRRREIMQLFQARVTPEVAQATIEAIKKGEINLGGRVQDVSVVMADIRGYSQYAELHRPEEVMEVIHTLRDMVIEEAFSFEGTVTQAEGDQAIAVFNAPLPQPDHAWRAVEASMAIKDRIDAYHQSLPEDHPHRLINFGYGTYTGKAIVGNMGTAQRYTYTAMGNAITIASNLAKSAKPSQIVIGEATYEAVKDLVTMTPLPPVVIKGEPAPISAYSAVKQTS